jgi:hypothetical protein
MALTEEMKRQISEDAGVKDAFKKGDTKAAKVLADLGLVGLTFLPAGAVIRGGNLIYKGMQGAKAAKELRKLKSVQDAIKAQRPAPGKPTTITAPKPKVRVPAGKPKQAPKAADKPKPTPPRAPGLAKNRQRVDGKPTAAKPAPKPAPKTKPKAKPNAAAAKKRAAAQRKLDALLATAVGAGALGAASKAVAPTKPKADPKKAAPKKRAKPGGTNKGADPKKAKPKARGPQTRGSAKPKSVRELEKLQKPRASGPSTRGGAKRGATKIVTAGKNVGFGPKGNIFPKNAADRARLMKLYGGTGSAAAKAAAAGKQGTLKKGKK